MERAKIDFHLLANRILTSKIWFFWSLIVTVLYVSTFFQHNQSNCNTSTPPPFSSTQPSKIIGVTGFPTISNSPQNPQKKEITNLEEGWSTATFFVGNSSLTTTKEIEYTSQVGQDRLILQILGNKTGGFFVDLASNDAKSISNTFTLETYFGWKGICIEANPKYFHQLAIRKCKKFFGVVGSISDQVVDFKFDDGNGAIELKHKRDVDAPYTASLHTASLSSVLSYHDSPVVIDYLSLDVEGAELFIMKGFPYDKYTFLIITAERPGKVLHDLFIQKGYTLITVCGHFGDLFYVHKSIPNYDAVIEKHKLLCLVDDYEKSGPWIYSFDTHYPNSAATPEKDIPIFGRVCSNSPRQYLGEGKNFCWKPAV